MIFLDCVNSSPARTQDVRNLGKALLRNSVCTWKAANPSLALSEKLRVKSVLLDESSKSSGSISKDN